MAREELERVMGELGLTVKAVFVPWSESRSAREWRKENKGKIPHARDMNLNWRVMLMGEGREIITTDYSAGIGHCLGYKCGAVWTLDYAKVIETECSTGKEAKMLPNSGHIRPGAPIVPDSASVVASLLMDGDALNYSGFEDWADSFGYDTDSRKAEKIYEACLDIALKLRNALGEDGIAKLSTAAEGF